nr:PolC-type DNA polymerase III [Lachnospiraceae bacterium]
VLGGIRMIRKIGSFVVPRVDNAPVKRTELHCHTKMSEMDGVTDAKTIIKRAAGWGWNSIAITDHGNVLAFPEANHTKADLDNKDFKIIYGVEGYLVDDEKDIVWTIGEKDGKDLHSLDEDFVVFDIETTGFSPEKNKIIEIGAVRVEKGQIVDHYDEFVNPEVPIPFRIESLTGINDSMVSGADTIDKVLPRFLKFAEGAHVVAHNAAFDTTFIAKNAADLGLSFDKIIVDTVEMARFMLPGLNRYKLDTVAKELNVSLENHHRAVDDAGATAEIFVKLCERLREQKVTSLEELKKMNVATENTIRKLPYYHVIILAKNETGRVNLYRLVSMSHLKYYQRRPRIPKTMLAKYREGLIIGSACEAGELFQALERELPEESLAKIVNFYDYLEIQPVGNNFFLLKADNQYETVEDLQDINKKIVKLGEQFNKPVCATCDVHFLDPSDEVYRRIVMAGKGFADADEQPPLFLRTTDEMLEEFKYLGEEKAKEVVITRPNEIADMVDYITPVRPDKAPPVIENSDSTLRDICYKQAEEIYGENLPSQVKDRLEIELKSIIGNGYAVMYIIAQKLVWKSVEDGYLVGSRGSVGSSFVANMAGITEVNSLPPHYLCPKCHYYDFDSPDVKQYAMKSMCGCDMPDKICPNCGEQLVKTGFDIPFETFLGFSGDKEPDIDLNFSGDYQSKAHKYTEVIFGAGQTFRAGTIGTLAEKTAYGYVRGYCEDHDVHKRRAEMERLAHGCEGILRTTGQHPGGIVVMPQGEEIYSFTPIQHPANDMTTPIITTHFEYHSIDHNLLKLDILGHDDPTMIRFLEDATGEDAISIPLDEQKVMSLFTSPKALGVEPDDIGGCPTGTLGIPEFGTDFVIQMLVDTQPHTFSDLIRISGLSHGTDVWSGNAQLLVNEKGMKLEECICCRDDIMLYLINKGMDPALSFKTMESVRKGKGLKPEMKEAMIAADVPEWYIDSCLKIKYMFPKAHAAAYVMMAWRVAWFKVYRPLAYYSAFFSIRAGNIDYATMCQGKGKLEATLKVLTDKLKEQGKNKMTATELDAIRDMRLVQEMYARGYDFAPIDINKADPKYFRQVDEKRIMPPLSSVEGMGGKAADALAHAIAEAAADGPFLSVDDFCIRTGCSKNMAPKLKSLGLLGDIPDSNQLSIFDFY